MFQTVREVGAVAASEALDCHYDRSGGLQIAVNPAQVERLEQELRYVRGLGFDDADYRWLDRQGITETLGVAGALAAIHLPHCAAIHPARLARGLAERLERIGVAIHEQSPMLEWSPGMVRTARGRVLADTIVLATEGYGAALAGLERRLIPVHSMMVATSPGATAPRSRRSSADFAWVDLRLDSWPGQGAAPGVTSGPIERLRREAGERRRRGGVAGRDDARAEREGRATGIRGIQRLPPRRVGARHPSVR